MIKDAVVLDIVRRLAHAKGPASLEAAATLQVLLEERNNAFRLGQCTMLEKVSSVVQMPPRVNSLAHWKRDMSPNEVFDMGALSAAGAIHKRLMELK